LIVVGATDAPESNVAPHASGHAMPPVSLNTMPVASDESTTTVRVTSPPGVSMPVPVS
jgi:hypothetical protein